MNTDRKADISRKTKETDITLSFNIDGSGKADIDTGIAFFDHMLDGFTRHGLFDLKLTCKGDLDVDCHHTVEDVGIVLGNAIREALGDKASIKRYGSIILPMDDALILCAIDLSARPYFAYECGYPMAKVGGMDTEMIRDFFYSISYAAGMNLHIKKISGENSHHMAEATFKAFAKALDEATTIDKRIEGVLSTKGSL